MLLKILITYIVPFIILMIAAIFYFKIALHFKIIDNPNQRSSHTVPTIRGGGVLFLLAAVLFFFWNNFTYPYLITAMLLSGIISFIDDIITVKNRVKFSLHVVSVLLVFKECELFSTISPLYLIGSKFPLNSNKLNKITSTLTFNDSKARVALQWAPQEVLKAWQIE